MNRTLYNAIKSYAESGKLPEGSRYAIYRFKEHYKDYSIKDNIMFVNNKVVVPEDKLEETLKLEYQDPKTMANGQHSFFDILKQKYVGIKFDHVKEFLQKQRTYQLHRPPQKLKVVQPIIQRESGVYLQIDTINLTEFAHPNNNYSYCLTAIDVFSKFAWAYPLKTLRAQEVATELEKILKDCPNLRTIQSDNGTEFQGEVEALLESKNIKHQHSKSHTPQSQGQIERFNKTLKNLIFQYFTMWDTKVWVPALKSLLQNYNNRIHTTTKNTPANVFNDKGLKNQTSQNIIKASKDKISHQKRFFQDLKVGDKVRILMTSLSTEHRKAQNAGIGKLSKSYIQQWSNDIYEIKGVVTINRDVNKFKLYKVEVDDSIRRFRNDELQLIPTSVEDQNLSKADLDKYGLTFKGFGREH